MPPLPCAVTMLIHIKEFSVGQRCTSFLDEKCCNREQWYPDQFFQPCDKCATQELFISSSPSHVLPPDSALLCFPQRAVRTEPEQLHASAFSTTRKSPRLLVSLDKWRREGLLSRSWAGIHANLHTFQCPPFKVQSLTYSLEELAVFLLLLSSTVMLLLLTRYKNISSCLEIGQMKYEEHIKSKNMFPIFLG